ncbi:MAG TPA: GNAT family N-acetyltransferase [Gammaproteobacteria bacterium]|jgi:hypothetical protein
MTDAKRIQAECGPLADAAVPAQAMPESGSCGLDLWQSPTALRWLGDYLHAQPALIQVRDGARQASLCCLLRRLPLGKALASAYPYAAIVGDAGLFWENGTAVAAALRAQGVVRLEMPFSGEYAHQADAIGGRFQRRARLDAIRHVLDLAPAGRDPAWLAGQLAPNTRWAVRKAERMGGRIRPAVPADLDALQAIYAAAMRFKGAPVNYGPERFRGMLEQLSAAHAARIYLGEIAGRPAGLAAVLDAGMSRHLLQLAVLPEAQSSRLSDLLVNTAILDCIAHGQRYFDFMASSPQDTGLVAFKAKWAGRAEPIRYAALTSDPLFDLAIDLGRWWNIRRARSAVRAAPEEEGA